MSTQHNQARAIFLEAIEQHAPEDRAHFLDGACAENPQLRARVEGLLRSHQLLGTFHDQDSPATLTIDQPPMGKSGTFIGPYKIRELIGEGGMGEVYVAEQTEPVRRKVALKIIRPGMATKDVVSRFEAERQALAMMDHPNIAKVFDAGTTGDSSRHTPCAVAGHGTRSVPATFGQPYFVMELVQGPAITEYCDQKRLSTTARLKLFATVCRAVQHAHQKGIIHRDLKPSNVLVPEIDGTAVPKVIDFGVAKAVSEKLTKETVYTHFAQMVGTPLYMSPEQAGLGVVDIDTRSDVYSLGVLLYELLTGQTPFDSQTLKQAGFDEMLRIIREEEPPKPSTRLSATNDLPTIAASRGSQPNALSGLVRGELDWIVMKALDKDRNRRYETANGLARDIEHYLHDQPVLACPPSASYRIRKFARRNKRSMLAAALVLLTLIGGIVATTWQAIRATQANNLALRRLAQMEKSNEILGSIFVDLDPREEEQGMPLRAILAERLEQATAQLDSEAVGDPLAVARLQNTLGSSQMMLGHARKALPLLEKSYQTRAALLGPDHVDTLQSMHNVAWALQLGGQREKALSMFEQAWAKRKEKLGPDHLDTLYSAQLLAQGYQLSGRHGEALELTEQIHLIAQNKLGPDHRFALFNAKMLAEMYTKAGRFDQALTLLEDTLARLKATLGADHFTTLYTLNGLAGAYYAAGRLGKAIPLLEETLTKSKQALGPDNPTTALLTYNLAVAYRRTDQFEKAVALFEDALKRQKTTLGPDHPMTLDTIDRLALAYRNAGDYTRAEATFLEALAIKKRTLASDDPSITHTMASLGGNYLRQKRYTEAELMFRECLEIRAQKEANTWLHFAAQRGLGASLLAQKKYADAEKYLVQGYQGLKLREATIPPFDRHIITEGLEQIVELYDAWGKPDEAAKWRTKLMNEKPSGGNPAAEERTSEEVTEVKQTIPEP